MSDLSSFEVPVPVPISANLIVRAFYCVVAKINDEVLLAIFILYPFFRLI
jgi:hypothetical protein